MAEEIVGLRGVVYNGAKDIFCPRDWPWTGIPLDNPAAGCCRAGRDGGMAGTAGFVLKQKENAYEKMAIGIFWKIYSIFAAGHAGGMSFSAGTG